jgi:hypothetical protein
MDFETCHVLLREINEINSLHNIRLSIMGYAIKLGLPFHFERNQQNQLSNKQYG